MCRDGLQHSYSLPFPSFPSVYSHIQSHSHHASDLIFISVPLPELIPILSRSHFRLTNERHLSLNDKTMVIVQNANIRLS